MIFEWKGFLPPNNGWRYNKEAMERLDSEGLLIYPKDKNKRIQYKRYLRHTETWTPSTHIHKDRRAGVKKFDSITRGECF